MLHEWPPDGSKHSHLERGITFPPTIHESIGSDIYT